MLKPRKPRNQDAVGVRRVDADTQGPVVDRGAEVFRGDALNDVEELRELRGVRRAATRQGEALMLPCEQLLAEMVFELRHVATDGAVSNAQLVRRCGDALMPRNGLEGAQRVQRRQATTHRYAVSSSG